MSGLNRFYEQLFKSPMGAAAMMWFGNAFIEAQVRPWLQKGGSDMIMTPRPNGSVQIDFVNQRAGQFSCLWQPPSPIVPEPADIKPERDLGDIWDTVATAEKISKAADEM